MEYRKLGRSGLKVSELSFGSWVTFNKQVDTSLAEKMFGMCFDAGINFFDNAEGYEAGESEIVMGKGSGIDSDNDRLARFQIRADERQAMDVLLAVKDWGLKPKRLMTDDEFRKVAETTLGT